ncbi:hypothetical protein ATW55_04720 [Ferroacidibacillus organovorans]|uniref:Uncharacterized protein n=1 Tax=Ferroacidibacillus organovorans TaxID=1765683 RepID=A0A101XP52_9BACL|nr:hypothetical protein ATW55_04720 [Ferroacidibacillus organovorans]
MIGIPTVLITLDVDQSGLMRPSRAIHPTGFRFGHSLGKPGDENTQRLVLQAALDRLLEPGEPGRIKTIDFPSYESFK